MLGTLLSTKKKGRKKENSFICYLFSWVDLGLDLKWPNWLVLGKERRQALLFLSPMSIFCSASYASPHDSSSDPLMEQETDLDISLKCRKFLSSILVVSLGRGLWSCLPAAFLSLYLNYWVIFFPRRNIRWLGSVVSLIQSYILGTLSVKFAFLNWSGDITVTCSVFLLCGNMLISQWFLKELLEHKLFARFRLPFFWALVLRNQASESCEKQAEQVIVELPDTNRNDEKPDKPASETENQRGAELGYS